MPICEKARANARQKSTAWIRHKRASRERGTKKAFKSIKLLWKFSTSYFPTTTKLVLKMSANWGHKIVFPNQRLLFFSISLFFLTEWVYGTNLRKTILSVWVISYHRVKVCANWWLNKKSLYKSFTCRASTASLMISIHPSNVALNIRYY